MTVQLPKRRRAFVALFVLAIGLVRGNLLAQELPIFAQRATSALLYNPAVAGLKGGEVMVTHYRRWTGLERSVNSNFFSIQSPMARGKMGLGLSVFNEKITLFKNIGLSGAWAYHVPLGSVSNLSFGLSADYRSVSLDWSRIQIRDTYDPLISNFNGYRQLDFSFGTVLRSGALTLGVSANQIREISSTQGEVPTATNAYFPASFSAFGALELPVASERDVLEPRFNIRYLDEYSLTQLDLGLYYTYNQKLMLGASWRNNKSVAFGGGVSIKQLKIQYARQSFASDPANGFGSSDEITIYYQFGQPSLLIAEGKSGGRRSTKKSNFSQRTGIQRDGKQLYFIKKKKPSSKRKS